MSIALSEYFSCPRSTKRFCSKITVVNFVKFANISGFEPFTQVKTTSTGNLGEHEVEVKLCTGSYGLCLGYTIVNFYQKFDGGQPKLMATGFCFARGSLIVVAVTVGLGALIIKSDKF